MRRRLGRVLALAGAGVLLIAGAARAEDGAVAPGALIIELVSFSYPYEGCYDASPTVDTDAWYEGVDGVRIPGSEFEPIVGYRRTSADVGFYVSGDAVDGYVVLDVAVLYDGCPDDAVRRVRYGLYRWRVDTSLGEPAPLPAGGLAGTLGVVAVAAGSFSVAQRRSTARHPKALGSLAASDSGERVCGVPDWQCTGRRAWGSGR